MVEDTWKGCTLDGKPPIVGREYLVNSRRKGTFSGRVTEVNDPWVTLVITGGRAYGMSPRNTREEGEEVTCRNSLCCMAHLDDDESERA